jgi:hypothetical protein
VIDRTFVRRLAVALILCGLTGVAVMAFFLWIYPAKGFTVPIGWDTSRYLWRTTVAQSVGLAHLQDGVPSYVNADPARPAFPVLAGTLASVFGANHFRLAAALPAVAAAAVALAAGGFVGAILRRPSWQVIGVSVGVGTSAFMVRMLGPEAYQDNLFAAAVFVAASTALGLALWDRRALLPAILLFGAGGVIHWAFFVFMVATVALSALAYGPESWRRWRAGEQLIRTPTARLAEGVAGGAAIAAVAIFGVLGTTTRSPRLSAEEFDKKLHSDLPKYRFLTTLPLAALGAVALWLRARTAPARRRAEVEAPDPAAVERVPMDAPNRAKFVLLHLLAWCAVALAGYLGFVVFHLDIPAHRFLAFALAVPILAVLGLLFVGDFVGRVWRPLGVAIVVAGLAVGAWTSHDTWFKTRPWISQGKTDQSVAMAAYLEQAGIDAGRPVVFLLADRDASYVALMTHMIRATLSAERIANAYFYAGSAENYLAERPTPDTTGQPGGLSERYFSFMRDTYDRDPVALLPKLFDDRYFDQWASAHPETLVAPDLAVVRGPILGSLAPARSPVAPASTFWLALLAIGSLVVVGAVGMGWTICLLGRWLRPLEVVAFSPAVGIAALVMVGIVLDRLGVRLVGAGGVLVVVVTALIGAGVAAWRVRSLSTTDPSPEERPAAASGRPVGTRP